MTEARILSDEETATWRARLEARYGLWYGGAPDGRVNVPYFTLHLPLQPDPAALLRALLASRAPRVIELNELLESRELDLSLAAFERSESFTFSEDLDWLVYVSHEETLTVAGAELSAAVDAAVPAWRAQRAYGT